ncbi:MAG: YopX family protein [Prevotella sp.]
MRTIKFKGKSVDSSEWVEGYYYEECDNTYIIKDRQKDSILSRNEAVLIAPDAVCQFTGFLDKNGNEIYEGDVLRSDEYPYSCIGDKERDNYYAVVYYCEEGACFGTVTAKNPSSDVGGISDGILDDVERDKMKNFEVIGNVHDPEWKQYREYVQDEDEEQHP